MTARRQVYMSLVGGYLWLANMTRVSSEIKQLRFLVSRHRILPIFSSTSIGVQTDLHGDISIASIDNTHESGYARPPLTTVHIPKYEIGVLAMRQLHRLISEEDTIPVKSLVYSQLIVRESAAPPRS